MAEVNLRKRIRTAADPEIFLVPLYDADEAVNLAMLFDPPAFRMVPSGVEKPPHAVPPRSRHALLAEVVLRFLRRPAV